MRFAWSGGGRIFDRRTVNVCKQEFRCKYTRLVCQSEGLANTHIHTQTVYTSSASKGLYTV